MEVPTEVRNEVKERAGDSEDEAAAALELIASVLSETEDRVIEEPSDEMSPQDRLRLQHAAEELFADVQEWASLASYAVERTYAPQSPLRYAGFSRRVTQLLARIVSLLGRVLSRLAIVLKHPTFSISVNFPWGVSASVSWTF